MGKLALLHLLCLCLAVVLPAIASPAPEQKYVSPDQAFSIAVNGDVITFRGLLTMEGVQRAAEYITAHPGLKTLAIESQGGETNAGMGLGDLMLENKLDVRVIGICASSCANYVFVSGAKKVIEPRAVILWHGSPLRAEYIPVTTIVAGKDGSSVTTHYQGAQLLEYMKRPEVAAENEQDRKRHVAFFDARGVDGRLTVFGQEVGCGCNWTFSVKDMARFGLDEVQADTAYPLPSDLEKYSIVAIALEDYAEFRGVRVD